jgi:hypothetical protein
MFANILSRSSANDYINCITEKIAKTATDLGSQKTNSKNEICY